MIAPELRREQEEAAWAAVAPPAPPRRRESPPEKLARGQREEREGGRPGSRPEFVKITPGVHVQTRGPVVIARFVPVDVTRSAEPWSIFRLPGDKRLVWDDVRAEIFDWISRSEQIGGPTVRISNVKQEARRLIREADGELGS